MNECIRPKRAADNEMLINTETSDTESLQKTKRSYKRKYWRFNDCNLKCFSETNSQHACFFLDFSFKNFHCNLFGPCRGYHEF